MPEPTRKELVRRFLASRANTWIDGPLIASPEVGGSEGLKRVRELRQDGLDIRMRKHPDPRRDIFQYRLIDGAYAAPTAPPKTVQPVPPTPGLAGRNFPLSRNEDGSIEIVWQVCPDCGGRYAVEADHRNDREHRDWLRKSGTLEGQTTIETPAQPEIFKYEVAPERTSFGESLICPRCKGFRHRRKGKVDDISTDPSNPKVPCIRCNGFGIVPNIGPVEATYVQPPAADPVVEAESESMDA